jgi:hypothetical protein
MIKVDSCKFLKNNQSSSKAGNSYPARWAPLRHEGEFSAFGIHSPSSKGVARSDGVVDFATNKIAPKAINTLAIA